MRIRARDVCAAAVAGFLLVGGIHSAIAWAAPTHGGARSLSADLEPVSPEAFVSAYNSRLASWRPAAMSASRVDVTSAGSVDRTTFVLQPDGSFTYVKRSKTSETRAACLRNGECYFRFSPKQRWIWVEAPSEVRALRRDMKTTIAAVLEPREVDAVTVPSPSYYRDVDTFLVEYANEDPNEHVRTTVTFGSGRIRVTEAVAGGDPMIVTLQAQSPTRIPMPVSGPCAPWCTDRGGR